MMLRIRRQTLLGVDLGIVAKLALRNFLVRLFHFCWAHFYIIWNILKTCFFSFKAIINLWRILFVRNSLEYQSSDKLVNCAALSSSASPSTTNQHFLHLFHLQNTTSAAFASFGVNARPRSRRNSSPQPSLHYQVDPEFLYKVAAYLFGDDLVQLERAGELLTLMRYSDGLRVYIPNSSLEQFLQFLFLIHSWFETPNIETRAMIEDGFILTYVSMGKRVKFRDRNWGDIAQRVIDEPNAGGGSILSEAYSAELLGSRLLGARRIYTEVGFCPS